MRSRTRFGWRATSNPATIAVPASIDRRVVSMRRVVVLPAPFGPSSPKISPAPTDTLTPRTASTGPLREERLVEIVGNDRGISTCLHWNLLSNLSRFFEERRKGRVSRHLVRGRRSTTRPPRAIPTRCPRSSASRSRARLRRRILSGTLPRPRTVSRAPPSPRFRAPPEPARSRPGVADCARAGARPRRREEAPV